MKTKTTPSIQIRRSEDRGHANHGWLQAKHSFSFGDYYDPAHVAFRSLRVINEDQIAAGKGFGTHPHSNMEIFTYVISGQLEHKDSMGNGRIISAGQFQYMSAGEGVSHSEFNPSADEPTHLLQIWITPRTRGGAPLYADMDTTEMKKENDLTLFASSDGREQSIQMRQDVEVYFGHLETGMDLILSAPDSMPHTWIQMIHGKLVIEDKTLHEGDGAHFTLSSTTLTAAKDAEFILFHLS